MRGCCDDKQRHPGQVAHLQYELVGDDEGVVVHVSASWQHQDVRHQVVPQNRFALHKEGTTPYIIRHDACRHLEGHCSIYPQGGYMDIDQAPCRHSIDTPSHCQ